MDNPLCLTCCNTGRVTPARVIDHIIPVRGGGGSEEPKEDAPMPFGM